MKRFLRIFSVLCIAISLLATGCSQGSSEGGSVSDAGPKLESSVFTMAVTATGGDGSSGADFSLSVKEKPLSLIFPAVSVSQNKIGLKVQPLKDGNENGTPILVDTASLTVSNNTISANVVVEATTNQYSVEVIAAGNDKDPLLKSIVTSAQIPKNGETLTAIVNASSTAFSMVYNQWLSQGLSRTGRKYPV